MTRYFATLIRVIVTPAIYRCFVLLRDINRHSTEQDSLPVHIKKTTGSCVFIKQLGSPRNNRFWFPPEPSFLPKLQLEFAEFPKQLYPNGHRLLTLETWCGYRYGSQSVFTHAWNARPAKMALCRSSNTIPFLTKFLGHSIVIQERNPCRRHPLRFPICVAALTECYSLLRVLPFSQIGIRTGSLWPHQNWPETLLLISPQASHLDNRYFN